jgi:hypothetical protein
MNNKLINDTKKNIVLSIKSFTEKIQKNILDFFRYQVGSGSTIPRSGSADPDPDPHQNEAEPKH